MNEIKVGINYINQRLDNFLIRELKNVPKSLLYRLIRKRAIRVNKKTTKPDYKLLLNDIITYPNIKDTGQSSDDSATHDLIKPSVVKLVKERIIYECNDFLILNKPKGMAVHAGSKIKYGVIDILRKIYGQKSYIELVHRLDRDTSGCLLFAKNRLALTDLHAKLQASEIKKTYLALVAGLWPNRIRLIEHPLRRSVLQGGERMVMVDYDLGKLAQTRVEVKARKNNTSLLELNPITGRTHQLRVHCAHEKHPIIGDEKYGNKELNKEIKSKTSLTRIFLHAYRLEFTWGKGGNKVSVTADIDTDLEKTLQYFEYI